MYSKLKNLFIYSILASFLLLGGIKANAEAIYTSDYAHVISFETKKDLLSAMYWLQKNFNLHMEVIVVPNFEGKNPEGLMDFFYKQLASRSPQTSGKGIIVVSLDDLFVKMRFSESAEQLIPKSLQDELTNIAAQFLKQEDFNQAVQIPVRRIYQVFVPTAYQNSPQQAATSSSSFTILVLILILVAGGIGVGYWYYMRSKKVKS